MNKNIYKKFQDDNDLSSWPQEFLRDDLLKQLLGDDIHDILYWSGKRLARNNPTKNIKELIDFFNKANLGTLKLKNKSHNRFEWTLSGKIIRTRINIQSDPDFMLETGFIAQSIEQQLNIVAEGAMNPKKIKKGIVTVITQIDPKDKISK